MPKEENEKHTDKRADNFAEKNAVKFGKQMSVDVYFDHFFEIHTSPA